MANNPVLQPYRPHAALGWVIRITGAIIAILSVIALGLGLSMAVVTAIHHPETDGWITALIIVAPIVVFGMLFLVGYSMYLKVEQATVGYFIFIFAALVAYAFFNYLPLNLPKSIADYLSDNAPFIAQSEWVGIAYRACIAVVIFFIFYGMLEESLFRILGYKKASRRQRTTKSEAKTQVDPYNKPAQPAKTPTSPR